MAMLKSQASIIHVNIAALFHGLSTKMFLLAFYSQKLSFNIFLKTSKNDLF